MGIKERIISRARELGFHDARVSAPRKLEAAELLEKWFALGYHAEMHWLKLNLAKRLNPIKLYSETRCVVSLAMGYYSGEEYPFDSSTGLISKYAWGLDYHSVLKQRLKTLLQDLKDEYPGLDGRYFVDTAPILEKEWAVRSGLGWRGKHSLVVTKDWGSWVFLGELLVNVELAPDSELSEKCGSCEKCIEACPTGAIRAPYLVDARRCIAYLTVEHRGDIPKEWRGRMGDYIWGCDICQNVCPWNQIHVDLNETFTPLRDKLSFETASLSRMTNEEFEKQFKMTCLGKAGKRQLVRNLESIANENGDAGN